MRWIAVAACTAGVAGALTFALGRPTDPIVGGNGIAPVMFPSERLKAGSLLCDGLGVARAPADALQVTVTGRSGRIPPLRLAVAGTRGSTTLRDYGYGVVAIPLPPGSERGGGRACVRNLGPEAVRLAGSPNGDGGAVIDGEKASFSASFRLVRFSPPTWSAVVSQTIERVGYGRGEAGNGSTGWIVMALFAAALLSTLAGMWRWAR